MPFHIRKAPNRAKYWVVDDTGKHYSIKPLPLERAKAQQRALYAAEGRGELKGEGIWDSLKEAYTQVADSDSALWSKVKEVGDMDSALWTRQFYPKYVQQWLDANGATPVRHLRVRRAPIQKALDSAFQAITQGKWQEVKQKYGYDDMFHLSLIGNNGGFILEKLDRINVSDKVDNPSNPTFMDVPLKGKTLTIQQMLDATQRLMGDKFFPYHPFTNNCQVFILKVLEANGLLSEPLRDFIFQPVDALVRELPGFVPKFAQTLTNIGANLNTLIDQAWGIVGKGHDGVGADVFLGSGRPQDAEAVFAALEGAGGTFPFTQGEFNRWEERAAERTRDDGVDLREQELRWRAIAHIDPDINPLSELGARVLADELFLLNNPDKTEINPGHKNAQRRAAESAYIEERERGKRFKAQVDAVLAEKGWGSDKRQDAYDYILEQRRRKAAREAAAAEEARRPPPPPPPGPGPAAGPKKKSPPAAKVAALPGIPEPPAAAGFRPEPAVDREEVRRLEEEAAEAAAREERERRATAAAEAERKRAAAAEAKAVADAAAAQRELEERQAATAAAKKAAAEAKDKKKKAAAEAKRKDAEEMEMMARETAITTRTLELMAPLDTQIGALKVSIKEMTDTVRHNDTVLANMNRSELGITLKHPQMNHEDHVTGSDLQKILDAPLSYLSEAEAASYKRYVAAKLEDWKRMNAKQILRGKILAEEVESLRRRIAEVQAQIADLERQKGEIAARVRREMEGSGGQHKDFPYSRPGLSKAEKAVERARHYRSIKKSVETLGSKAKATLVHDRTGVADQHEAFHRAKRETEAAAPEKKLFGYYRNLYEVTGELPPEVAPKVAARGPRPKVKKETLPKSGSVRKPYVGKVMKESFMKAAAGRGEKEVRNLFNRAKREYKEGGKSWEAVTAAVLGL